MVPQGPSTELWNLPYYLAQHTRMLSPVTSLSKAQVWLHKHSQIKQNPLSSALLGQYVFCL